MLKIRSRSFIPVVLSLFILRCSGFTTSGSGSSASTPGGGGSAPVPAGYLELLAGQTGGMGWLDGLGSSARSTSPSGIASDASGTITWPIGIGSLYCARRTTKMSFYALLGVSAGQTWK